MRWCWSTPWRAHRCRGRDLLIWLILGRRERRARWGDAWRGAYESLIRWALIRLASQTVSARSWRPHVLVFVSDVVGSLDAIRFANWFSQGRGIVTVCQLQVGLSEEPPDILERELQMRRVLTREGLVVFPEFEEVQELISGMVDIAQANGIAGLASNTVMVGWPDEESRLADFLARHGPARALLGVLHHLAHPAASSVPARRGPSNDPYLVGRDAAQRRSHDCCSPTC